MDAIKKKMEKLANETNEAEMRIAHFEDIKAANELEVHFITIDVITKILTLENKENVNLCILGREIRGSVEECPEEDPGIVNKIITEMTFINIFDRQWSLSTTCASKTSSTRYHHLDQPRNR